MSLDADKLLRIIRDDLAIDDSDLQATTPLFSSGLIDSFSLVTLMASIEKEQGIVIAPDDIKLENFDTVDRILAYLRRAFQPRPEATALAR